MASSTAAAAAKGPWRSCGWAPWGWPSGRPSAELAPLATSLKGDCEGGFTSVAPLRLPERLRVRCRLDPMIGSSSTGALYGLWIFALATSGWHIAHLSHCTSARLHQLWHDWRGHRQSLETKRW